MASGGSFRRRPDLWSYISFSRPNTPRSSDTLPLRNDVDGDPYEKEGRRFSGRLREAYDFGTDTRRHDNAGRNRYLKIGGAVAFVLFVLYLLSSSGSGGGQSATSGSSSSSNKATITTKCTKPYDSSKPLIQYALMVDAGSTGSRIHVYRFNNCGPTPELEHERFEQTAVKEGKGSGLSSYDTDADGAAKSLDVLLDAALEEVPDDYRSCTPIAVKATAGLRKLGEEKSERILTAVRRRLETVYPFPLVSDEKGGVEVMDGMYEGVYAWITTNFLLGRIGGPDKHSTAAVFDLGGGSTQIVFEPTFPDAKALADGDHKYALAFGGRDFTLYQHSYLGYGLMAARENLHRLVFSGAYDASRTAGSSTDWLSKPLINPCITPNVTKEVKIALPDGHPLGKEELKVTMAGPMEPSGSQCRGLAEKALNKEKSCALTPCAFEGVYQPPLSQTFDKGDIYLFSYFYDRLKPLGMPDSFTISELSELTDKVCAGEQGWSTFAAVEGALKELRGREEYCLDMNFMLALLHHGYEMPLTRRVRIAKKIKGNELGWCLGASLPLLSQESGWTCKLKEIS